MTPDPFRRRSVELHHAMRPTKIFFMAASLVGASTSVLPYVTGYGTSLFQVVALGAWGIVAAITSDAFADTYHSIVWAVALVLNLILFLIPASAILFAARKRWPVWCSVAIFSWSVFYLSSLFWLFPATDGP